MRKSIITYCSGLEPREGATAVGEQGREKCALPTRAWEEVTLNEVLKGVQEFALGGGSGGRVGKPRGILGRNNIREAKLKDAYGIT